MTCFWLSPLFRVILLSRYNLDTDPGEVNLIDNTTEEYKTVVAQMRLLVGITN